ncbi:MAG: hypothetical protein M3437_20795 [Chloroflexota bacterium]|nr:hypothetical protein [Chloroflexota bacterium]MDQ5867788.1 hypothetical protein [Chloroflexota bacterium]
MADFDEVTIIHDGKEIAALAPDLDQGGNVVGGKVILRDQFGKVAVGLSGGNDASEEALAGGTILIRNGEFLISNLEGRIVVRISLGDVSANGAGGKIMLMASDDSPSPTLVGDMLPTSAIVLDASKRSIMINSPDGETMVQLGPNAGLTLGGGHRQAGLILNNGLGKRIMALHPSNEGLAFETPAEGEIAHLGANGHLTLGVTGIGSDGSSLVLRDSEGDERITLYAGSTNEYPNETVAKIAIKNRNTKSPIKNVVEIGGGEGEIVAHGNLTHQRITERSVKLNNYDEWGLIRLFSVEQNGFFKVEVAVSYSVKGDKLNEISSGKISSGSCYLAWNIFTYKDAVPPWKATLVSDEQTGQVWEYPPAFKLLNYKADRYVYLQLPKLVSLSLEYPNNLSVIGPPPIEGTLSVTAFYGSLNNFD